jgi:hypothetical protein
MNVPVVDNSAYYPGRLTHRLDSPQSSLTAEEFVHTRNLVSTTPTLVKATRRYANPDSGTTHGCGG